MSLIPIDESVNLAVFNITENTSIDIPVNFFNFLAKVFTGDIDFGFINSELSADDLASLASGIQNAEYVIFTIFGAGVNLQTIFDNYQVIIDDLSGNMKKVFITDGYQDTYEVPQNSILLFLPSHNDFDIASLIVKLTGKTV